MPRPHTSEPQVEAKSRIEAAVIRLEAYSTYQIAHNDPERALWSLEQVRKHILKAKLALQAWKRLRA